MFLRKEIGQLRESFDAQFEASGSDYIYRKNGNGDGHRMSARQRDEFVRLYARRVSIVFYGFLAAILAFIAAAIGVSEAVEPDLPDGAIFVGAGSLAVITVILHVWIRNAPSRYFAGRLPTARALTDREKKQRATGQITYVQLALWAGLTVFIVGLRILDGGVLIGYQPLWLVFGAVMLALLAIAAWRKWRFDTADRRAASKAGPIIRKRR